MLRKIVEGARSVQRAVTLMREPPLPGQLNGAGVLPLFYMNNFVNFGDYISKVIVEHFSGRIAAHASAGGKFIAVGSVMHSARAGDVVWGTGVHPNFLHTPTPSKLDVRAVRGPLTRTHLLDHGTPCPEVYGDPGILLPMVYEPKSLPPSGPRLLAHVRDVDALKDDTLASIDIQAPWQSVIDEICSSEVVVSTSLHGLIVAEAYGVPAVWLRVAGHQGVFKYLDYYASTERFPIPVRSSAEALDAVDSWPVPDLSTLSQSLVAAFPENLRLKSDPSTSPDD